MTNYFYGFMLDNEIVIFFDTYD